jgi:hypothetical protein
MGQDEASARRLVRIFGGAVLVLGIVLFAVMPKTVVRENVGGLDGAVIGFELATTPGHVLGILGHPGDVQRPEVVHAMDLANRIDFLFMIAYPALSLAIALWLVARGAAPRALPMAVGVLALAMWAGDLIENLQLLKLSQTTDAAAMASPLAILRIATRVKWKALFLTALLEGAFVWRDASGWRWSALVFAVAGVLGMAGFVGWLPGVEHGANLLGLAWAWTWVHSLRARPVAVRGALATADLRSARTE